MVVFLIKIGQTTIIGSKYHKFLTGLIAAICHNHELFYYKLIEISDGRSVQNLLTHLQIDYKL